ncbi:MAG: SDR family oxidoreductase [Xanthomonadales bacterium]|nr:SDR family oxidoreductase [Xanthomonadales bacterium]
MGDRVKGKVALITGAASGLGKADALALAEEGATVILTDINEEAGSAAAAEIAEQTGATTAFFQQDVGDENRWNEIISQVESDYGGLHVLVNNAGIVICASPEDTSLEQFQLANRVMSESVFLGCRAAIPLMNKSGGGSIINMSSVASHLGYPVFFAYTAAKGAVRAMTKSIAVHCQWNGYNIRCNSVHPSSIDTPMIDQANKELGIEPPEPGTDPVGIGEPKDVANLVVFLASDESRFINGSEIMLDNCLTIQ